jgi:predicted dehydrogenase
MARLNLGIFRSDVNVLWDLAPHDLSILLYIMQEDPIEVFAHGRASVNRNVHDIAYIWAKFSSQVLAHIHVSWLSPRKVRQVTIVGSKKMVVCDDLLDAEKIKVYDQGVEKPYETDQFVDFPLSYRYGNVTSPHIPMREPLQIQCQHFAECILTGCRPETDGLAGLRVVRLLERADMTLRGTDASVSRAASFAAARPLPDELMPDVGDSSSWPVELGLIR